MRERGQDEHDVMVSLLRLTMTNRPCALPHTFNL